MKSDKGQMALLGLGIVIGAIIVVVIYSIGGNADSVSIGPVKFVLPAVEYRPTPTPVKDEIIYYRVSSAMRSSLHIEVDYRYDPIRGREVGIWACLLGPGEKATKDALVMKASYAQANRCGWKKLLEDSGTEGVDIIPSGMPSPQTFERMGLCLTETNKPLIVCRDFPLAYTWEEE